MWKNFLDRCKNKSGFQQMTNSKKIFFPLAGVDFSELRKICIYISCIFIGEDV
jgi:hypothetical protein